METKLKIGFIGLGKMGNPMSKNLLKAGYPLTVYDCDHSATEKLGQEGATIACSAHSLAEEVDVIISSIPDDNAMEDVAFGRRGIFHGAKAGTIYIDMSTISPKLSARVGETAQSKNVLYLRAPVSGSTESAEAGILTIMVSGPQEAYDRCKVIFDILGQKVFHVGSGDEARYLKLLVNIMVGVTSAVTAEALIFGQRGGLDWNQMIDIINNSVVASPLIGFKTEMLKKRKFPAAFSVAQMSKDFDLTLEAGQALDIPLPLTSLTRQLYGMLKATARGEFDYFGLVTLMEEMAGAKS